MPEISRFFGIVIRMYFDDHNPPHIHAAYAGYEGQVGIEPHWQRLHNAQPAEKIKPLE
jgi:hypothetical protein